MEDRILLVSISKMKNYSNAGLDLIAGYLRRKGYTVDIKYYHKKELEYILKDLPLDYKFFGFSVYSSNYDAFKVISKYVKDKCENSIVLWGGAFCSMYYKDIFEETKCLDYLILGDGEKPFEYIIENYKDKSAIDKYPHIVTKDNQSNKYNYCNQKIDYLPAFDYYKNFTAQENKTKIHCLQSKNNVCTGICSFCYERKGAIVYKDVELIISEIEYVSNQYGVKKFYFSDDNLLDPNNLDAKKRVMEICLAIEKLEKKLNKKFVFTCYIKAVSFSDEDYDHELLSFMSRIGFATMFIGIESGNDADLLLYRKLTTVKDNYTIIDVLNQHNIVPLVGFINYNPYTTPEKLAQNYQFLTKIHSNNLYSYACSFLNLYKGTLIYQKALNDGLVKESYTILNDLEYKFMDSKVTEIVAFVREYMLERLRQLDAETSWVNQRCEDAIRLDESMLYCRSELKLLRDRECEKIEDFFYWLFVEVDIEKCKLKVDAFLKYFEDEVPILEKYLEKVNEVYGR